jgi:hypothetical protein
MATPDLTSGQVMDQSAALLNDANLTVYSYAAQLPYLNMALQELQELFELNDVPVTQTVTSSPIAVATDVSELSYTTVPPLPSDMIEPQQLWERAAGIDPYVPMTKLKTLPLYMEGTQIPQLLYYVWESQKLTFLPANADNEIKIVYVKALFTEFTNVLGTDQVNVINAASFLEYRNAALCAEFIGENPTRAAALNNNAILAMDRVLGIGAKGGQAIMTRRRPFRAGWKRRSFL